MFLQPLKANNKENLFVSASYISLQVWCCSEPYTWEKPPSLTWCLTQFLPRLDFLWILSVFHLRFFSSDPSFWSLWFHVICAENWLMEIYIMFGIRVVKNGGKSLAHILSFCSSHNFAVQFSTLVKASSKLHGCVSAVYRKHLHRLQYSWCCRSEAKLRGWFTRGTRDVQFDFSGFFLYLLQRQNSKTMCLWPLNELLFQNQVEELVCEATRRKKCCVCHSVSKTC